MLMVLLFATRTEKSPVIEGSDFNVPFLFSLFAQEESSQTSKYKKEMLGQGQETNLIG